MIFIIRMMEDSENEMISIMKGMKAGELFAISTLAKQGAGGSNLTKFLKAMMGEGDNIPQGDVPGRPEVHEFVERLMGAEEVGGKIR